MMVHEEDRGSRRPVTLNSANIERAAFLNVSDRQTLACLLDSEIAGWYADLSS